MSWGCAADKGNRQQGARGARLLHVTCPWWKTYFGSLLKKGRKKKEPREAWPTYCHGLLQHRRREDGMAAQRIMGEEL